MANDTILQAANPKSVIGEPRTRLDGALKVTGAAHYASDLPVGNPAHAYLVTSAISRGKITGFDLAAARAVPGVIEIMTHEAMRGLLKTPSFFAAGGYSGTTIMALSGPDIRHDGEIVAVVLAETFEAAREAANAVVVHVEAEAPSAGFGSDGTTIETAAHASAKWKDAKVGDAEAAFAAAPVKIDAQYATPAQHHSPIELFTTTCAWDGDMLTVYEPSQFMYGLKYGLAEQLGIDAAKVRTVSPFVGGAFGSKGAITPRTALIAVAAKRLGRPVKLVATRDQGFTIATYRAETRQHVKLAASHDGKLQALVHEGQEVTSRPDPYLVGGTSTTARIYACPNIATKVEIVHADRNTPGFMRSPPEVPYMFALESAMDELAVALAMDPVELRRVNDTMKEPIAGLPYTSRSLMQCFDIAAEKFGWADRPKQPGQTRDGDWLIGYGCATSCYPSHIGPSTARVTMRPDGTVTVQIAAHEIGTGAMTVLALTAADKLGVKLERVTVELGDSNLPPAPVAGGSNNTASNCNTVALACEQIRDRVARAATTANSGAFAGTDPAVLHFANGALAGPDGQTEKLEVALARTGSTAVESYAEFTPKGAEGGIDKLYHGRMSMIGGTEGKEDIRFAFGAEFVEVRVHAQTGEIRVPRILGVFAAGTIVNPLTARSQVMGGLIWGISSALHEATEIDARHARYTNDNLSDYLVPVNADVGDVQVVFIAEEDHGVNALGIKGLGELGNVGTNAAVANAIYNATGKRMRELPIRLEHLMA